MSDKYFEEFKFLTQPRETLVGTETPIEQAEYIAFGVPYDLTSSFRPGSRYGPEHVRRFSMNIELNSYYRDFDAMRVMIYDAGNIVFDYRLSAMLKRVYRLSRMIDGMGKVPVMIGGEHTFTLAAVQALRKPRLSLLVFDAHLDLRDEYCGLRINHATYLRRLSERRPEMPIMVVGARGYERAEVEYAKKRGITILNSVECGKTSELSRLVEEFVGGREVYLSVDIDVLDPAYAPGVGNPEPGGLTTPQILEIINMIRDTRIVGFDIMEVSPLYDNGSTSAAACRILFELLATNSGARYL